LVKNRNLSWLVLTMFLFTCIAAYSPVAFAAPQFKDIQNHWAADQIKAMVDLGVVSGYADNTFRPDNQITRAEFMTLVNKTFKFTASAEMSYPDVKAGDWFASEVSKAKAAGYIAGYQDGTIKPNNQLSRQEAAAMIARAAKLEAGNEQLLAKFGDAASIPGWSRGAIAAMVSKGYIAGYSDGTFKPTKTITRAEAVAMLAKAQGTAATNPTEPATPQIDISKLDKAGTYGPAAGNQAVNGNVTISASGVVLQNATISGDLLIAEAVGNGDVTLKNVTVKGTTTIKGGGANTVRVENCALGKTVVNKSDGNIRILFSGTTSVTELVADSAVKVEGQATIAKATINKSGVVIEPKPASVTIASGIQATISGKTETGTTTSSGGGGGGGGSSTPTLSITAYPAAGAIAAGNTVTLTPSVAGAQIYYTTDGSTPTTSSTKYTAAIVVNSAMTIKAIAVKSGYTNSSVYSFAYTIANGSVWDESIEDVQTVADPSGNTVVKVFIKSSYAAQVTAVTINQQAAIKNPSSNEWRKTLSGTVAKGSLTIVVTKSGASPAWDESIEDVQTVADPSGNTVVKVFIKSSYAAQVTAVTINQQAATKNPSSNEWRKTLSGTVAKDSLTIVVTKGGAAQVDKTALNNAIASAQSKKNAAVAGSNPGNYPQSAIDDLGAAITNAQSVADNASATQTQVDSAVTSLNAAIAAFDAAKVQEQVTPDAVIKSTAALIGSFGEITFALTLQTGVTASSVTVDGQALTETATPGKYKLQLETHSYAVGSTVTFRVITANGTVTKTATVAHI